MHPVHNAIRRGSGWFYAWHSQACTPWAVIEKKTGIKQARLAELDRGGIPTAGEQHALAALWHCPVEQIGMSVSN